MKSRAVYVFSSILGPIVGLVGLAGMFGFGLPAPYWLAAVLFGAALILFGQRGIKVTRPVANDPSDRENELLARKRHQFWIFVAVATSLYAVGAYWLPFTDPKTRQHLIEAFMVVTFGLCVGIFIYSTYTNRRM
jgi:hypothetical protein